MLPALFTAEVSTIESQIAKLQSQINQLQSRKVALGEAEATATGMLQVIQEGVAKIAGLAPDAIATLKTSILALLDSGDSNQSGGQAVTDGPAPLAPSDTEVSPALSADEPEVELIGQSCELCSLLEDAPAEVLVGQVVEIMCPVTSHVTAIYEDTAHKNDDLVILNPLPITDNKVIEDSCRGDNLT